MKNRSFTYVALILATLAVPLPSLAAPPPAKCGGADIANGPFAYEAGGVLQTTFSGAGGDAFHTSFTVTAPSPSKDTEADNVFPGQGATNECAPVADAVIGVLEITKVADADGNPITPEEIEIDSVLGSYLADAFAIDPTAWNDFAPGASVVVDVTVSNPAVGSSDYGQYTLKLAAKADGYGIGVGPGVMFTLTLLPASETDTVPPVVTVTKPVGDELLGIIPVEVQAYDPATPGATGLASMSASISSAGGAVSNVNIPLTLDQALPVAPGVTVTGVASIIPTGGTGPAGTTLAAAFTALARSGIGNYTITAQGTDVAGNTDTGSKTFNVNYAVAFTKASSTTPCQTTTTNASQGSNCTGQFKFSANRSAVTSDGAFMFDKTVVVKLVRDTDNSVAASHIYGMGSITSDVQITTDPTYQTNFKRGDIAGASLLVPVSYKAKVYFKDVDGTEMLQGESISVTF